MSTRQRNAWVYRDGNRVSRGKPSKTVSLGGGSAAPLFGLEDSVREVTMGRSFAELQELYDRMVWIDSRVEAEHFVHTLLKELG